MSDGQLALLPCLECGEVSTDVRPGLAMVPVAERAMVSDVLHAGEQVPGIYAATWRCRDRGACADRVITNTRAERARQAEQAAEEEL